MNLAEVSPAAYARWAEQAPNINLLQAAPWAEVKANWEAHYFLLQSAEGTTLGGCLLLIRRFARFFRMGYVAHGPLLNEPSREHLDFLIGALRRTGQKLKLDFLRLHPAALRRAFPLTAECQDPACRGPERAEVSLWESAMAAQGFRLRPLSLQMSTTIQPRFQAVVPLQEAFPEPSGKLKYNLKQLERYGVEIQEAGAEALPRFARLIKLTEERQGIRLRDLSYFQTIFRAFPGQARLFFATLALKEAEAKTLAELQTLLAEREALASSEHPQPKKERILAEQIASLESKAAFFAALPHEKEQADLAAVMLIHYGNWADMPYAGSDDRFYKIPSVWGLYYAGIRSAEAHACRAYNLGGLEGSLDDGLSGFKAHFNPLIEESLGEFDYDYRPLKARLFRYLLSRR